MMDRITVASLLAAQNVQRQDWRLMTPEEQKKMWELLHQNTLEDEEQERASTIPGEEWGDLEDHGWMGTSIRNNPTIQNTFPSSFG